MDTDRIRTAPDNALDPTRLVERQELQARAFDDLGRALDSMCTIPGPGLDTFRSAAEHGATAAYRLADLARADVPTAEPGTVHGIRPHRITAADDEELRKVAEQTRMISVEYVSDLLGVPPGLFGGEPLAVGDTVTVDLTAAGGGRVDHVVGSVTDGAVEFRRACRIHSDRYPCEGGCPGRRPPSVSTP